MVHPGFHLLLPFSLLSLYASAHPQAAPPPEYITGTATATATATPAQSASLSKETTAAPDPPATTPVAYMKRDGQGLQQIHGVPGAMLQNNAALASSTTPSDGGCTSTITTRATLTPLRATTTIYASTSTVTSTVNCGSCQHVVQAPGGIFGNKFHVRVGGVANGGVGGTGPRVARRYVVKYQTVTSEESTEEVKLVCEQGTTGQGESKLGETVNRVVMNLDNNNNPSRGTGQRQSVNYD